MSGGHLPYTTSPGCGVTAGICGIVSLRKSVEPPNKCGVPPAVLACVMCICGSVLDGSPVGSSSDVDDVCDPCRDPSRGGGSRGPASGSMMVEMWLASRSNTRSSALMPVACGGAPCWRLKGGVDTRVGERLTAGGGTETDVVVRSSDRNAPVVLVLERNEATCVMPGSCPGGPVGSRPLTRIVAERERPDTALRSVADGDERCDGDDGDPAECTE